MAEARALLHFSSLHAQSDTDTAAFSSSVRTAVRTSLESRAGSASLPEDALADAASSRAASLAQVWDLPASVTGIRRSTVSGRGDLITQRMCLAQATLEFAMPCCCAHRHALHCSGRC